MISAILRRRAADPPINSVYRTAESGLWRDGAARTTASELAELIAARQIAVAARDGKIADWSKDWPDRDLAKRAKFHEDVG